MRLRDGRCAQPRIWYEKGSMMLSTRALKTMLVIDEYARMCDGRQADSEDNGHGPRCTVALNLQGGGRMSCVRTSGHDGGHEGRETASGNHVGWWYHGSRVIW